MHRWLEGKEGRTEREKVVSGFEKRIWEAAKASEEDYHKLGKALSLTWRDFAAEAGSLDDYAKAPRDKQKKLLVDLIDYELFCAANDETREEERVEPDSDSPEFDLSVDELKTWRDEGRPHVLIDVRTHEEYDIAQIDGSTLIPMNELPERLEELDENADIVVHCHHGPRSSSVVSYLRSRGFPKARNLSGGINMWSLRIDPSVRQY